MMTTPRVSLTPATPDDATVVGNLLQLYAHDLSAVFGLELGPDGRFSYPALALYWTEPARRFAFLIRDDGRLAGFVLATRGSPADDDPTTLDVAEFFIARRWRRGGVGRAAAQLLWERMPGLWTVRVSEGNALGLAFWEDAIARYAGRGATRRAQPGTPHPWRVFTFASRRSDGA